MLLVVLQPERGGISTAAQCRQIGEAPQGDHDREAAERSVSDLKKPIRFVLPFVFGAEVHSLAREAEPAVEFLGEFADLVPTLHEARLALHREAGTDDALLQQFIEDSGENEFPRLASADVESVFCPFARSRTASQKLAKRQY